MRSEAIGIGSDATADIASSPASGITRIDALAPVPSNARHTSSATPQNARHR
jgi:hypothetical protein